MTNMNAYAGSQPPPLELIMQQGPWPGYSIAVADSVVTIGRQDGNDIVIADAQVSGRHASLNWDGAHWILQDLSSTNGTYVNRVRIVTPQVVHDGDAIGLGPNVVLGFQSQPSVKLPPASPWIPPTDEAAAPRPGPVATEPRPEQATPASQIPAAPKAKAGARGARRFVAPLLVTVLLLACLLVAAGTAYYLLVPRDSGRPVVLITSPQQGEHVEVGQEVSVQSVARDKGDVTRVELWVDGQLQEAQASTAPEGISPFPLVAYWQPPSPGVYTLTARAFNARGGRALASVSVEAMGLVDRDGDGVPDEQDQCPDEPGSEMASGCLDRDDDGIPDAEDACPDERGVREHDGCPGPTEEDRDGDGILDDQDDCPDQPGVLVTEGCPDADGDAVPDAVDACPAEPGAVDAAAGAGCPAPGAGDQDGDGVPDADDACLAQAGSPLAGGCSDRDGDGVHDGEDSCPDDPGPPENRGCPVSGGAYDNDGDGSADAQDSCPDERGLAENDGCPDTDGDGFADDRDRDPDNPGPANRGGAPETGAGDSDGDGLADDLDACDDEAGLPQDDGCPPPTAGESGPPPQGPVSIGPPVQLGPVSIGPPVDVPVVAAEFQALGFEANHDYPRLHCYAQLAGSDPERHEFEAWGARHWDIPADLGSRTVVVPQNEPLELFVECEATEWRYTEQGLSVLPHNLGSFLNQHPRSDWTGAELEQTVAPGPDAEGFRVRYRICEGSCAGAAMPPPVIIRLLHGVMGTSWLAWGWDASSEMDQAMALYVNGNFAYSFPRNEPSIDVGEFEPPCGGRTEFYIRGFSGPPSNPDRESPRSNIVVWEGDACPRTARVSLISLQTRNVGDEHGVTGPIYGNFDITGGTTHHLAFRGVDYASWVWEIHRGFRLVANDVMSISGMFTRLLLWQQEDCDRGGECPWSAPGTHIVTVELGPEDALMVGGLIRSANSGPGSRATTLFNESRTFAPDEIVPGDYSIDGGNVVLHFRIDQVESTEAVARRNTLAAIVGRGIAGVIPEDVRPPGWFEVGVGSPMVDLTVSDVTLSQDGQLQMHVLNRGRLDLVDTALDISVESGGQTGRVTSQHNIPAGLSIAVPYGQAATLEGTRIVVDPDDSIDELSERNNEYLVPARRRVEFVKVSTPFCNEWSSSIVSIDSEFVYYVWAGHGHDWDHVTWVAKKVRFPASGQLRSCTDACDGSRNERWVMAGNPNYTFDVEVPGDENLYVMVTGTEMDSATDNDPLGDVRGEYGWSQNWGARAAAYEGRYDKNTKCDDWFCQECLANLGLYASWRISEAD